MKKFLKKMFVFALAVLCLASATVSAFASQGNMEEEMSEGYRLWDEFLDAVASLTDDSGVLDVTEAVAGTYSRYYAEGTGRSEEEYLNMTARDKLIWRVTYIAPYIASVSPDYNGNRGTLEKWLKNGVGSCKSLFADIYGGNEELRQAYEALMTWDYYYLMNHGAVWCFMEGKNTFDILYPEEKYEDPEPSVPVQDEPIEEPKEPQDSEEIPVTDEPSVPSEEPTESVPPVDEKPVEPTDPVEKGLWDDTKAVIKEHLVSVVLLVVLVIGLVVVIAYRKKKAVEG